MRAWHAAAVAFGAWALVVLLFTEDDDPAPSFVAPAATWRLLGSPLRLVHGQRYRGCVAVPWPLSPSVAAVKAHAEAEGFSEVVVSDARPSDWPAVDCKHFVEATWSGADKDLELPGVVRFAWVKAS